MSRIGVIGSGFAGLSSACFLAKAGFDVTLFEKNDSIGGRARKFTSAGFTFDMGPSWYWMPDVFDKFFHAFGFDTKDFYSLKRLDPSYRVVYGKDDYLDIPAGEDALCKLFESIEPGSAQQLRKFLQEGKFKYDVGIKDLVYKPGLSLTEFFDIKLMRDAARLHVFSSISSYIRKFFKNPRLIQLLEFPVLFLGATPEKTPALYSLMNYADMSLGTWYPMGGMHRVIDAMATIAKKSGVKIELSSTVQQLEMNGVGAKGLVVNEQFRPFDYIVAGADYHHVEQHLIPVKYRRYDARYWDNRTLAPSSLIYFLGVNKRIKGLLHHTLFFDQDFKIHAKEIYEQPQWPSAPQFYVSCPSKTDDSVAPVDSENIFILIPVAPGLNDTEAVRNTYFDLVMERLEALTGESIRDHIVFKRSYAHNDFISDYNAFKGNAYGLANTLRQTANLKPSIINKKINNLFYTGQLTVPGPGVPPSIISGEVVANELIKRHQQTKSRL
ncbi:phytoene desaturase family protein [Pseudochryseolinea flava]|uniref:Phytoene desaturase n=1 Tax=Pseudochryseolinea flava TaxID=2059302 RepID=A0A364XW96_9BACT|nr:phytoene desaturase family protein [Pseudochryseolinea flava]RAV98627.1 phytoene desaturase [Pseudochryseolinea flava]